MPSAGIRVNSCLRPYKTSPSVAIRDISVSSCTWHLRLWQYKTSPLRPYRTSPLQPYETHLRLRPLYATLPPLATLHGARKTNIKQRNDAHSSLLKTLHGKCAGKEHYHSRMMAMHINKEISFLTTSNWPPVTINPLLVWISYAYL